MVVQCTFILVTTSVTFSLKWQTLFLATHSYSSRTRGFTHGTRQLLPTAQFVLLPSPLYWGQMPLPNVHSPHPLNPMFLFPEVQLIPLYLTESQLQLSWLDSTPVKHILVLLKMMLSVRVI
ncbi:hypothetical protein BDQ17DRAFT_1428135 [Cyathus striatus]|nr:hypothetical protein BDQ17DRAFT_1428135 [Cyathus striatus]